MNPDELNQSTTSFYAPFAAAVSGPSALDMGSAFGWAEAASFYLPYGGMMQAQEGFSGLQLQQEQPPYFVQPVVGEQKTTGTTNSNGHQLVEWKWKEKFEIIF